MFAPHHHRPVHLHHVGHHRPHVPTPTLHFGYHRVTSQLAAHHLPLLVLWAEPVRLQDLATLDGVSLNHAVIWLAALASAGVSAAPGVPGLISWDSAINEAMVLFLMRGTFGGSVKRVEAKEVLMQVGRSVPLTYKGISHVKRASKWAKRSGHPLGAGLHAAVAGTSTFATGLAAMRAVEKQKLTAKTLRAALPDGLDSSLAWAELIGHKPGDGWAPRIPVSAPAQDPLPDGTLHDRSHPDRTEPTRSASGVNACGALAEWLTRRGAPAAAAACHEVAAEF